MWLSLRRRRVRAHLITPQGADLPSIEGILVHRGAEYVLELPALLTAVGRDPSQLQARAVVIPRERLAFYEVL